MNKYQEDYGEFIKDLKYIDELIDSLTMEQRKALGATTWSIQGILGRYINEEKDFIKELVDKETPMKPRYRPSGNIKCGCGLQMYEEQQDWYRYCASCGQKIDWRVDNEL